MVRSRSALFPVILLSVLLLVALLLAAPSTTRAAEPGDNAVLRWDNAVLDAIRATGTGPTVAARALAIVHTAMYDAWTAYDAKANPTRRSAVVRRPAAERTDANKIQAVSQAAYRAAVDLFPTRAFNSLLGAPDDQPSTSTDVTTPAGIGNVAAQAVLDFRHRDGANQLADEPGGDPTKPYSDYTGYTPRNQATTPLAQVDPRFWQPLIVNGVEQRFLTPHFGRVTPFSLSSGSQFRPPAPPSYQQNVLKTQVDQMISISANLTDEQKVIVEFWRNGFNNETPPGMWAVLAQWVSKRDANTLDEDVKLFFGLGNALLDASIAVWDTKRAYESIRPITAVRKLYNGKTITAWGGPNQGTKPIQGQNWLPYQPASAPSPPFPDYTSGHTGYSFAAASVLSRFTGSDSFGFSTVFPARTSKIESQTPATDITLRFPLFDDAAVSAALSRRYGGIHFLSGDTYSRQLGKSVGNTAANQALEYISGRRTPRG